MAPPNISYGDIVTTTLRNRSPIVADNLTKNNALYGWLAERKNIRTIDGGSTIIEPLKYGANPNFSWYSGYDLLPVAQSEAVTAAEFTLKLCSDQVVISGEEELKNSGKEKVLDLLAEKTDAAETTVLNQMAAAVYADGTAFGGKAIIGLDAIVPVDPTTGTYGGISRVDNPFWRPYVLNPGVVITLANIQGYMNTMYLNLMRGADHPDLIISDNYMYSAYESSLQQYQRFTSADKAKLGFRGLEYKDAMVVADGGIGGFATAKTMYFLNSKYLRLRPHKDRNMVPITPKTRAPINQDASVIIFGWAGAMTCNNQQLQGRLISA